MTDITADIIADLGFADAIGQFRATIETWVNGQGTDMRPMLEWQFLAPSKYFRPLTIFACHHAITGEPATPELVRSAVVLEMLHNVSLIIDDILDASPTRRGKATLHTRFGQLPALMASGHIVAEAYRIVADDPHDIRLCSALLTRLGIAECTQWRLRRQPLGIEDWRDIAGEDTGSMFETCACLATRDNRLRRFGGMLGTLYHGCDDVGDVRGLASLGGGGEEDLRDGILTLPAAIAIRDPKIRESFCKPSPIPEELAAISDAMKAALPESEAELDRLAAEARWEAQAHSSNPAVLYALVEHTRGLADR